MGFFGRIATDRATRPHLEDIKDQIAKVLDPKIAPASGAAVVTAPRGFDFLEELLIRTLAGPTTQ